MFLAKLDEASLDVLLDTDGEDGREAEIKDVKEIAKKAKNSSNVIDRRLAHLFRKL